MRTRKRRVRKSCCKWTWRSSQHSRPNLCWMLRGKPWRLANYCWIRSPRSDRNAEASREEILLQVDVAFFTALKAQSVLDVARQTLETRKLLLDQVAALATNKLRSDLDLSFSKVAYEEGNLLVAKAQNDLEEAFAVLSMLLRDRAKH